jgi:hypothetical protein
VPFDPCGMIFDFVRSCYTTKALFVAGGHESTIRWYFAPDGAQVYPHHHSFASLNWSGGSPATNVVGEIKGKPRPWSNGTTPECACGTSFWGTESQFLKGAKAYLTDPHGINTCGLPEACPVCLLCQPFWPWGGVMNATMSLSWRSETWDLFFQDDTDAEFIGHTSGDFFEWTGQPPECGTVQSALPTLWILFDDPGIDHWQLLEYDEDTGAGTWQAYSSSGILEGFEATLTIPPLP